MNHAKLRTANIAAATLIIGGALVAILPQHGLSIIQLVVVTVAAAAALHALVARGLHSKDDYDGYGPFDKAIAAARPQGRPPTAKFRTDLRGARQPQANGRHLPPAIIRTLKPLILIALERRGVDPNNEQQMHAARQQLSPITWAVLDAKPSFKDAKRRADERQVAEIVHHVLDDLERGAR